MLTRPTHLSYAKTARAATRSVQSGYRSTAFSYAFWSSFFKVPSSSILLARYLLSAFISLVILESTLYVSPAYAFRKLKSGLPEKLNSCNTRRTAVDAERRRRGRFEL